MVPSQSCLLSVQLYTLRALEAAAALDAVAEAGFSAVELYGSLLGRAELLAPELAARGLNVSGSHVGLEDLEADPMSWVENAHRVGAELLVIPSVPKSMREMNCEGWKDIGVRLARLGEAFAADGIRIGYHNHDWDLREKAPGKTALDIIFEAAGSAPVYWEADVAWLVRGGADPEVWLNRFSDRLIAAHVKDLSTRDGSGPEGGWADLGHGILDWTRLWPAAIAAGARALVVEHDLPDDPRRTIIRSINYINQALL